MGPIHPIRLPSCSPGHTCGVQVVLPDPIPLPSAAVPGQQPQEGSKTSLKGWSQLKAAGWGWKRGIYWGYGFGPRAVLGVPGMAWLGTTRGRRFWGERGVNGGRLMAETNLQSV